MHITGQLLLLLVLLLALGQICDTAVIATAIVAQTANHVHLNQNADIDATSELKLDIFVSVPFQKVNIGDMITLQVNLERTVEGAITAATSFGADNYVFSGKADEGGEFYLSCSGGTIIGHVEFTRELLRYDILPDPERDNGYLIRSVPSSVYEKEDFPDDLLLPEMTEEAATERYRVIASAQGRLPSHLRSNIVTAATPDTNSILDVMFLFTPQALASIGGGQHSMDAMVIYCVQLANDAYANSNVPLRMRSVGVFLTRDASYKEAGFQEDLNRLRFTDGIFDEDVAQRTSLGADAVVLFVAGSSYCGLAYQWATADLTYGVVSTQCPTSVVHEVGHNIGCQHDRVSEHATDLKAYNFGYCWDTSGSTCSRSVMAYPGCVTPGKRTNCPRVAYFSSPLVTYGALGRATGVENADNARVLREQTSRATNWAASKQKGGLVFAVQPSAVAINRCEPVTITGWRLGTTGSDITTVTINGVPVQRIMSQGLDSLQVLAGRSATPGVGDIVITTRSGYTTTVAQSFAYEPTSGLFRSDFEAGMGPYWTPSGALQWTVVRYCNSLPCAKAPIAGPSVGAGGAGSFAKLVATEVSDEAGALTTLFNQNSEHHGCAESVHSISLFYHLWNPLAAQCGGSLTVSMQSTSSDAWVTILTATARQATQDDPWLPLSYTFPDPAAVGAIRITASPYKGMSMCYYRSSVSVDQIVFNKTTTCTQDGCDLTTNYPTAAPTIAPSTVPTIAPTSVAPTRLPTVMPTPTPAPTFTIIIVVEAVQFTSSLNFTGVTAAEFQSDANNAALFLRTVASNLDLPESSLCCVLVEDLPDTAAAVARRALATSTKRMRISYTTKLLVERLDEANTVSDKEYKPPSPLAAAAVDQTVQLLTQRVSSGSLLQALVAALPSSVASALVVEPVSASSFSAPQSQVAAATSTPSTAPSSLTAPASLDGNGSNREAGWSGLSLYLGIVAIVVAVFGSALGAWVYTKRSNDSAEHEQNDSPATADESSAVVGVELGEVPSTPSSSMRNAAERSRKDSHSSGEDSLRGVPGGAWVVPPSPSRKESGMLLPPPSQAYMQSLYTPRGSARGGLPLISVSSLLGAATGPQRYQYQQVSTVNADESRHQAPYQDIIDSVNRASSRDLYEHSAPAASSWYAPTLHDPYAGADGPYNAPMVSIHRTPRAPASTPTHARVGSGEIAPMMSSSTSRGSTPRNLPRVPTLHLQYGSPDAVARARSETDDAPPLPLPSRMPRIAGLPFPPSIAINTTHNNTMATTRTPRADSIGEMRPETGFSSGVSRQSTPHSVPFMHQQLHQQHQVHNTPRGVASREGTPRHSSNYLAIPAVATVMSPNNPAFPPALTVVTDAAPIVLRQQRNVPRAYSEKIRSEERMFEEEGRVPSLVRHFSSKSCGGTPICSGNQPQGAEHGSGQKPAQLLRGLSGAATTTAVEIKERTSGKHRPPLLPTQQVQISGMKAPQEAEVLVLTHAQMLARRLESPIAVAGFSPSNLNNTNVGNNNVIVSDPGKGEATSTKPSGSSSAALSSYKYSEGN